MSYRKKVIVLCFIFLAIALSLLGLRHTFMDPVTSSETTNLTPRFCDFYFSQSFHVRCFYYWTHTKGVGFKLPVALIKHKDERAVESRDLLVQIPGGPGQGDMATAEEITFWVDWLEENKLTFDLLLFDPRGTGSAAWRCDAYRGLIEEVAAKDISFERELSLLSKELRQCFLAYDHHIRSDLEANIISKRGLKSFSSFLQAKDIDAIAGALAYENVHLWGTSYGSRLALLAADFDRIKSLILDSPYVFDGGLYSDWPFLYQNSFSLHQKIYSRIFPESEKNYLELYNAVAVRLAHDGLVVAANHWLEDREIPFFLNTRRLLELNFFALYNAHLYKPYYLGLEQFNESGDVSDDFQRLLDSFMSNAFDKSFNYMAYFATECVDNRPETEPSVLKTLEQYPEQRDYFLAEWQYNACELFDFSAESYVQNATYSSKPTLIFSGEFDPVTPKSWGADLHKQLPVSRYVLAKNLGHSVLFDMNCDWQFLQDFFRTERVDIEINCKEEIPWR